MPGDTLEYTQDSAPYDHVLVQQSLSSTNIELSAVVCSWASHSRNQCWVEPDNLNKRVAINKSVTRVSCGDGGGGKHSISCLLLLCWRLSRQLSAGHRAGLVSYLLLVERDESYYYSDVTCAQTWLRLPGQLLFFSPHCEGVLRSLPTEPPQIHNPTSRDPSGGEFAFIFYNLLFELLNTRGAPRPIGARGNLFDPPRPTRSFWRVTTRFLTRGPSLTSREGYGGMEWQSWFGGIFRKLLYNRVLINAFWDFLLI